MGTSCVQALTSKAAIVVREKSGESEGTLTWSQGRACGLRLVAATELHAGQAKCLVLQSAPGATAVGHRCLSCHSWCGRYIKDYDGGTLMECKMEPIIPYTALPHVLRAQSEVSHHGTSLRTFPGSSLAASSLVL